MIGVINYSTELRTKKVDFALAFAVFGGPRPPEVGSRLGSEINSTSGPIFYGF